MRFAFITPRYGADIAGGAEHACRLMAEQVSARHEVDVLTTCAREPVDVEERVRRRCGPGAWRPCSPLRRQPAARSPDVRRALQATRCRRRDHAERRDRLVPAARSVFDGHAGILEASASLVRCARILFLVHATTIDGVQVSPERSIVFPYLRLRPTLRFGLWADLLASVKAVGFVSDAERQLMERYLRVTPQARGSGWHRHRPAAATELSATSAGPGRHAGSATMLSWPTPSRVGADLPVRPRRHVPPPSSSLRKLCALRRTRRADNGCEEMLEYLGSFAVGQRRHAAGTDGRKDDEDADERHLRLAGVLPDRERMAAYEAADVTLAPSSEDLLAQDALESFAVGTPVLACARSQAAVESLPQVERRPVLCQPGGVRRDVAGCSRPIPGCVKRWVRTAETTCASIFAGTTCSAALNDSLPRPDRGNHRSQETPWYSRVFARCGRHVPASWHCCLDRGGSAQAPAAPARDSQGTDLEGRARGAIGWLVGSMHLLTPDFYPLPASMEQAFAQADMLMEEIDLNEAIEPAVHRLDPLEGHEPARHDARESAVEGELPPSSWTWLARWA